MRTSGLLEACNRLTNAIRDVLAGVDHGDASGRGRAEGGDEVAAGGLTGAEGELTTRRATARSRHRGRAFFVVENSIVAHGGRVAALWSARSSPLRGPSREGSRPTAHQLHPPASFISNTQRPSSPHSLLRAPPQRACVPATGFPRVAMLHRLRCGAVLPTAAADRWAEIARRLSPGSRATSGRAQQRWHKHVSHPP